MRQLQSSKIKLLDALELRIASRDGDYDEDERLAFTWDVQSFDGRILELQLYIEEPLSVTEGGQFDALYVTFYGTELFKSAETGNEVRFGTQLTWDLYRMMEIDNKEAIEAFNKFFYGLTVTTLVLSIPMLFVRDLLPTMIFFNSLSLIAHTPLLNSQMPGNV